jgi:hypothetical protein
MKTKAARPPRKDSASQTFEMTILHDLKIRQLIRAEMERRQTGKMEKSGGCRGKSS